MSAQAFQKSVARGQVGDVGSVAAALARRAVAGRRASSRSAAPTCSCGSVARRLALVLLGRRAARRGDAGAGRLRSGQPRRLRLSRSGGRAAGRARRARSSPSWPRPRSARGLMRALAGRARHRRRAPAGSAVARASRARASGTPASRSAASSTPRRRARAWSRATSRPSSRSGICAPPKARRPDVDARASALSRLSRLSRRDRARSVGDVSREPDVVEYDLDLPDALLARSTTIAVAADRRAADAALRRLAGVSRRRSRVPHRSLEPRAPALERARTLLSLPTLNCDHIRDPVTIASP